MKQSARSKIGIIGCGNMGAALIRGLQGRRVWAYDKQKAKLSKVERSYKAAKAKSLDRLVAGSSVVVIAVKPQDIGGVLKAIKQNYKKQLIISIAAGVTTSFIERKVGLRPRVVRVMPNLAATIGMSVSALARGKYAGGADLAKAKSIFDSVGVSLLLKESQIDAFTALCGSGPGYVYYFMDALLSAGRSLGIKGQKAEEMVVRTVIGAVALASSSKESFKIMAQRVASKGGTTEAAFKVFDKYKLKAVVKKAAQAARQRARSLSRS
jgi:pyrroline-5-carboxylate reductase